MTEAGYKRATELKLELKCYRDFAETFANASATEIRAFRHGSSNMSFDLDGVPELKELIRTYIAGKISALEKEFEQLN